MSGHVFGHFITHVAHKALEENQHGRKKSAFGLGLLGVGTALIPVIVPILGGLLTCATQPKVEPKPRS
jgi:hypothetical protein